MTQSSNITICVKLAYTCITKYYSVTPDMYIKKFIELIKDKAHIYFQLEEGTEVEIVEAGQFNNINGRDAELAPAVEINPNITLREKYEHINYNVSFYIRPVVLQERNRVLSLIHPDDLEDDNDDNGYISPPTITPNIFSCGCL